LEHAASRQVVKKTQDRTEQECECSFLTAHQHKKAI